MLPTFDAAFLLNFDLLPAMVLKIQAILADVIKEETTWYRLDLASHKRPQPIMNTNPCNRLEFKSGRSPELPKGMPLPDMVASPAIDALACSPIWEQVMAWYSDDWLGNNGFTRYRKKAGTSFYHDAHQFAAYLQRQLQSCRIDGKRWRARSADSRSFIDI